MSSDKTEFLCFNKDSAIIFHRESLKLLNQLPYLGTNISSTENDVNIRIGKAWTVIERLMLTWKYNFFDEIKKEFFQ